MTPSEPLAAIPDDPYYLIQRVSLENLAYDVYPDWALRKIGLNQTNDGDTDSGWDVTTGSDDIVVATYGTGLDYTLPDIENNVWLNPGEFSGRSFPDLTKTAMAWLLFQNFGLGQPAHYKILTGTEQLTSKTYLFPMREMYFSMALMTTLMGMWMILWAGVLDF